MKSTIGQINEPGPLFWEQEWKYNGDLITAIHGCDESTKEFIASAPAGYVMISTRTAIPYTNRFEYDRVPRMVSPDAEITA